MIDNPVGSGRFPLSRVGSDLIRSPNPIDRSGNLVITGNVAGGRHFRGAVPYQSASSFGAGIGSSSLDSFLRRSASSGDFGRYAGRYTPYYSPSATVTSTVPGRSGVFRPAAARIGGRAAYRFAGAGSAIKSGRQQALSAVSSIKYRPMRFSPQELEQLVLDGVATYAQAKRIADEQNLAQMERLRQDLKQLRYRAPQLKQSLVIRDDSLRPFAKFKRSEDVLQPLKVQKPKEQKTDDRRQTTERLDVYEQMKQRIDELQKGLEQMPKAEKPEEADSGEKKPGAAELEILKLGTRISKLQEVGSRQSSRKKSSPLAELSRTTRGNRHPVTTPELSDVDVSAKAKGILGPHKTFASFSDDKFNQHLRAGEMCLKQGRYYRAVDSFTLASIYKPDDPLAYAGRSHALFAAGEYMSSALFLSRALEIFPEYARFKIDLVAMVGDRDKLESRIVDVEEWLQRSDAAELQFLLGYVYYQMGRLQRAKEAIDAAYEKLPDSPAVIALKRAIDSALAGNQDAIK
jgi:tetratricopeptide (TPR) repeat protein